MIRIYNFAASGGLLQHVLTYAWSDSEFLHNWQPLIDRMQKIQKLHADVAKSDYVSRSLAQHNSRLFRAMQDAAEHIRRARGCNVLPNVGGNLPLAMCSWVLYPYTSQTPPTSYLTVWLNPMTKEECQEVQAYNRSNDLPIHDVYAKVAIVQGDNPDGLKWFDEIMYKMATYYPRLILTTEIGQRLYAADVGAWVLMRRVGREAAANAFLDAATESDLADVKLT